MVNAQEQLNKWFPEISDKSEVKSLAIFAEAGEDSKNDNQEYCFYNTQLEGELDLKGFYRLEDVCIKGGEIFTEYQKITKLWIRTIRKLTIHNFATKVEIELPFILIAPRRQYLNIPQQQILNPGPKYEGLVNLTINNCPQFKIIPPFINNASSLTFDELEDIKILTVSNCSHLTEIDLSKNKKLTRFYCSSNSNLTTIKGITKTFTGININNCPALTNLVGIANLNILSSFSLVNCPNFVKVDDRDKLIKLKKARETNYFNYYNLSWLKKEKEEVEEITELIELSTQI